METTSDLVVLNPQKKTIKGKLSIKENIPQIGEKEVKIMKIVQKYEFNEDGTIAGKKDIDTSNWEIVQDEDFELLLTQKRIVKLKFARSPEIVEQIIQLSSFIYRVLYELQGLTNAENEKPSIEILGKAESIRPELDKWCGLTTTVTLELGETLDIMSTIELYTYYLKNNSQIKDQMLVFLARG